MSRLVLLVGTGTSVGKTYAAERLLRALGSLGKAAMGYKPVESGVAVGEDTDIARLERASTFHVKPTLRSQTFTAPVSPHVASRLEGRQIDLEEIRGEIRRGAASPAEAFLVELPGGAFSPLTDTLSGAEFARSLPGARVILVGVDRLGVLHDVAATTLACAAIGLPLHGVVLNEAEQADASVDSNLGELPRVTRLPILARLPRQDAGAPVGPRDPALRLASDLFA
jgi:dethiobiotin synthetase